MADCQRLPLETLLDRCRQQPDSDMMLLFVRAICAAGLMLDADSLLCLQAVLVSETHRSVLALGSVCLLVI